ncbi:MAG: ATPase [Gemmatales bacterium]|nr:MAG: ATPase [Gemmatales bacterium]
MTAPHKNLDQIVDATERLGVVGSPSSTAQLSMDVLGSAVSRKLVGELALFRFAQDGTSHYALGQITEVQLRNVWHEDPTMRSLIRQRGRVDAVSERQDTHLGQMVISAVFRQGGLAGYEPSILGTVPATGTPIHLVSDDVLDELLRPYHDQLFYLGHVYGSKPKLPLWFKHFDRGPDGAGEAYHLGIFGKTGSGKSALAKMILLAYARYPKMALLVVDPQGEFSRDMKTGTTNAEFPLPVGDLIRARGKDLFVLTVRNLVLDRWGLFRQILAESRFFRELQIMTQDKVDLACDQLTEAMRKTTGITLATLHDKSVFKKTWNLLKQDKLRNKIYAREGAAAERFKDAVDEANPDELYHDIWLPVARLFKEDHAGGRRKVEDALKWLLDNSKANRPVLVVDVSKEQAQGLLWNDTIQALVIKRLLEGITLTAETLYKEGQSLNALVVIDEAHRLAPRELPSEDDAARGVRSVLIDAARTTRKYGLGWLFISQTLSSLHPEILQQLRIFFFGFGLALGQEFQSLRQLVGSSGTALDLYQLFRDPHSAFDTKSRQYSFMTIGPVSPLSFSGTPLFLNAFNTVDAFLASNKLKTGSTQDQSQ